MGSDLIIEISEIEPDAIETNRGVVEICHFSFNRKGHKQIIRKDRKIER